MATTTKYRFELLFHGTRAKCRKRVERGLMFIAGKPKKKVFHLRGFNCVMFLRIGRKILTSTDS